MKKASFSYRFISSIATVAVALSSFTVSAQAPKNITADTLKVITYNIWTQANPGTENSIENRSKRLEKVITDYDPDSAGFQEAQYKWMDLLTKETTSGLGKFSEYGIVGVGRENGTIDKDSGEASPIIYKKDKFNLMDSGTFWLSKTPDAPSIDWGASYKRVCTYAILENKTTKQTYAHFNTHLDHMSEKARVEGAKLIVQKIKEYAQDTPVVVTGDMNATVFGGGYRDFADIKSTERVKLWDSLYCAETKENVGGTMCNLGETITEGGLAIDHMFISTDYLNATKYKVIKDMPDGKYISDHFGVYSEITFEPESNFKDLPKDPYEKKTFEANYATTSIDATKDSAYDSAPVVDVNKLSTGGTVPSNYASGKVQTVYDSKYLYFFAEVTDPNVNSDSTVSIGGGHQIDGFQVYFDFDNTDTGINQPKEDYYFDTSDGVINNERGHFIVFPDDSKLPFCEFGAVSYRGNENKLQYKSIKTSNGYNVEGKIALSNSLQNKILTNQKDIKIGIGYQINDDSNDDGKRDLDIYANALTMYAWESPAKFDDLNLAPLTESPVDKAYEATKGTPVAIDGQMDETYFDAQAVMVNRSGNNSIVTTGIATATVRTVYDDNYVYSFAYVEDPSINSDDKRPGKPAGKGIQNYGIDGIQFFYDFNPIPSDANDYKWRDLESGYFITDLTGVDDKTQDSNIPIYRNFGGFAKLKRGTDWEFSGFRRADGKGYNIEIKVPLSPSLKLKLKAGEKNVKIRAGFQINDDSNNDGLRNNDVYSNGSLSNSWNQTPSFGAITIPDMTLVSDPDVLYSVKVNTGIIGGTIKADVNTAKMGSTITLAITPNEGMQLDPKSLNFNGYQIIGNTFLMPSRDVTINANFVKIPQIPLDDNVFRAAKSTPIIDGYIDEIYKGTQAVEINKNNKDVVVSDMATGELRTVYDENYIYCLAKVTDLTPNKDTTRNIINKNYGVDGVQFFIDFNLNKDYTKDESGYITTDLVATDDLRVDGSKFVRLFQGFSSISKSNWEYRSLRTETGYNTEIKIPLSKSMKTRIANGEPNIKMRIGAQINDDTNDNGERDKLCFTKGSINEAWNTNGPSMLSSIYLTGQSAVSYYVTTNIVDGGKITADKLSAAEGEVVTLTVNSNAGKKFKAGSLKVNSEPIIANSFVMPGKNVVITAEFEDDNASTPTTPSTGVSNDSDNNLPSVSTISENNKKTINVTNRAVVPAKISAPQTGVSDVSGFYLILIMIATSTFLAIVSFKTRHKKEISQL